MVAYNVCTCPAVDHLVDSFHGKCGERKQGLLVLGYIFHNFYVRYKLERTFS